MLKRQRPSSPLPGPSSSTPFLTDSASDLVDRDSKRRRTAAPVLEGHARGWPTEPIAHDDDEEYIHSDDEISAQTLPQPLSKEYKSTNTMLRELHTLHQHRLLFASPSAAPAVDTLRQHDSMLHSASSCLPATSDKGHLPGMRPVPTPPQQFTSKGNSNATDQMSVEDASRVAELYEETNRFLGSLFLSRRRKLESADEIPATQS